MRRMFIVVLAAAVPAIVDAQTARGDGANVPLALQASCDAQVVRVQVANKSDKPAAFVLGFNVPNGQTHVVNAISVFAIRPATGADEEYVYVNPKYALATGAPWTVTLAPGATHDLELPLKDFISSLNYSNLEASVAGGARLVLESRTAGRSAASVWTGKVQTVLDRCRQ